MEESLGKCLSSNRIKQGLSIGEVVSITRINERFIRSVEDDRFDQLPGDVFIKGLLRTYAKQLGLDGDELVAQYNALHIVHTDQSPHLISIPLRPKSSPLPIIGFIIILIGIAAFAYYYLQDKDILFTSPKSGFVRKKPVKPKPKKVEVAPESKKITVKPSAPDKLKTNKSKASKPKKVSKAPEKKKNENISSGKKLNKPEKAKVYSTTAPKLEDSLVTKKEPVEAKEPTTNETSEENDTRVNLVIP